MKPFRLGLYMGKRDTSDFFGIRRVRFVTARSREKSTCRVVVSRNSELRG